MKSKAKNCLVTGGAGFVGSHMVDRLTRDGHNVWVIDNLSTGKASNLKMPPIVADVNLGIPSKLKRVKFDWIFHYAATVGVKRTLEDPLAVLEDVDGLRNIMEFAKENGPCKVMYSSSSEVYGNPVEIPEREDGHTNAKLPYAIVKLYGEQLLKTYNDKFGVPTVSLRFFNVYGPRQDGSGYGFVVGVFMNQALRGHRPTIYGDGSQTRDFVYIDDNIEATIRAMENPKTNGQVINIGCGRPSTIYDLAEKIIKVTKAKVAPKFLPDRALDIKHRFPDTSKMQRLLEYRPKVTLEEGLKKTVEYYSGGKK